MLENVTITRACVSDARILADMSVMTFNDTFSHQNSRADMDKYLQTAMSIETISSELQDEDNYFYLAWHKGHLAGYCKLRANTEPDITAVRPIELERIYVLKQFQGKKVGAVLMQHTIDFAQKNRHDVLWLGVWELNFKALSFYKEWGFELCGSHPFLLGDDLQTDMLMCRKL